jgi:hypothetical protein
MKILVDGTFPGSSFKNQHEVAKGLSKERDSEGKPLYDVTMLVLAGETKVKLSDTLHTIEHPVFSTKDIVLEPTKETTPPEIAKIFYGIS